MVRNLNNLKGVILLPQIKVVIFGDDLIKRFKELGIGKELINKLQEMWPVTKGDVTYTLSGALEVINDAKIQVEVRFSAGYDYGNGKKFNPDMEEKDKAASALLDFLIDTFSDVDVSVWIIPYKNSCFAYSN